MGMVGAGGRKRGFPRLRSATPGEDVGLFTRGSRCAPVQRRQLRRLNPGEVGTTRGWGMGVSMDARWTSLRAAMSDQRSRNALDVQLLTLRDLFGVRIPSEHTRRPMVRFQHWRRIFTARHPVIGAPVRLASNVAWGALRFAQANDLAQRGPVNLGRRIARTLLESDGQSKI